MQRKNHLRLILGIILIGSLAVLLIGYFALRKPAAENPSMPAPSISSSSASPSATELPTGLAKADPTNQPTAPVTSPKGASSNQTASAPAEENGITPVTVKIDSQKWYLTLVSIKYRLPDNYQPELTYPVKGIDRPLDARVTPHYVEMYNAAKADGCTLTPYSGWRSISRQKSNYENNLSTYMKEGHSRSRAELLAAEWILPPGASEHNMGVAMDIVNTKESFENTKEFKWLQAHAADYGFILRYPKDKVSITKVAYEPWHWRYVGVEDAKKMKASGKCLEEYLGIYNS